MTEQEEKLQKENEAIRYLLGLVMDQPTDIGVAIANAKKEKWITIAEHNKRVKTILNDYVSTSYHDSIVDGWHRKCLRLETIIRENDLSVT